MIYKNLVSCFKILSVVGLAGTVGAASAGTTFLYQQEFIDNIAPYVYNDPGRSVVGTAVFTFNVGATNQSPSWEVGDFTKVYNPTALRVDRERSVSSGWYGSTAVQVQGNKFAAQLHTYSAPLNSPHQPSLKTINFQHSFAQDIRPWSGDFGSNSRLCSGVVATVPSNWIGDGSNNQLGVSYIFSDVRVPGSRFVIGSLLFNNVVPAEETFVDPATQWAVGASRYGANRYITTSDGSSNFTTASFQDPRWFGFCITRQNIKNFFDDFKASSKYNGSLPELDFNYLRVETIVAGAEISIGEDLSKNGHMAFSYSNLVSHVMSD